MAQMLMIASHASRDLASKRSFYMNLNVSQNAPMATILTTTTSAKSVQMFVRPVQTQMNVPHVWTTTSSTKASVMTLALMDTTKNLQVFAQLVNHHAKHAHLLLSVQDVMPPPNTQSFMNSNA